MTRKCNIDLNNTKILKNKLYLNSTLKMKTKIQSTSCKINEFFPFLNLNNTNEAPSKKKKKRRK